MFAVVGLVSTVLSQVPAQFTVNNLGTPAFNGTYVVQDANAEYPVYVNQTDPQYVLFGSGPPPGLPFIPAYWKFSKFTGYTGTGSMSGLQKEDFYSYGYPSYTPLGDPTTLSFSGVGAGVVPAPGSPEAGFQLGGGGGNSVFVEQAEQLNEGLTFQDGQWTPSNN